jgi:hypothetical protein
MASTKSEKGQETVVDLGSELGFEVEELLKILRSLGMKEVSEDSVVPARIGIAARGAIAAIKAKKSNVISLPSAKEETGESKSSAIEELPKGDIKAIASSTGLSQKVVRELDQLLVVRELQIAFVEGFQEIQLKKDLKQAKESGRVAAQLLDLKTRESAIADKEQHLLEIDGQQKETVDPINLAGSMGIDLTSLLGEFGESTEPDGEEKKPCLWELVQARLVS